MTSEKPPVAQKRLLIVWWSYTGGTESLVQAVAQGASEAAQQAASVALIDAGPDAAPDASSMSVIACRCDLIGSAALLRAAARASACMACRAPSLEE
jgi:hypothetical protein